MRNWIGCHLDFSLSHSTNAIRYHCWITLFLHPCRNSHGCDIVQVCRIWDQMSHWVGLELAFPESAHTPIPGNLIKETSDRSWMRRQNKIHIRRHHILSERCQKCRQPEHFIGGSRSLNQSPSFCLIFLVCRR